MIQEHKLRDRSLENLENRLMSDHTNWILEAASENVFGSIQARSAKEE